LQLLGSVEQEIVIMTDQEYRTMLEETLLISKSNQERYAKVLDIMEETFPRLDKLIDWCEAEKAKEKGD
jgi:PHD/YefM family antitoxin component YafN of YafNO toxin-antitoxin module